MSPFAGGEAVRLTASPKPDTRPRWSPDGRYLAFLSKRDGKKKTQVWLIDRRGGEAVQLTDFKANVSDLAWSKDASRLALVVKDVDPEDADDEKAKAEETKDEKPKPIVVRRLQTKRDGEGFLRDLRTHIYVFDVARKTSVQVTAGPYDDRQPAWSPDGRLLAFTSNRTEDPDANDNTDVFVVEARSGAPARALTTAGGSDSTPVFSPDGSHVAYLAGGDAKDIWYATNHVALVPVAGGAPRALTPSLDRNVSRPAFGPDGKWLYFLLEDGGNSHLARVSAAGGPVERVVTGERDIQALDVSPKGEWVVLESQPHQPFEVSAVAGAGLRRITTVNDAVLKGIRLGKVERFQAKSADGTTVHGFVTYPPDARPGRALPAILRIHGGPVSQFSTEFQLQWHVLAAQGYAVIAANPRGSSGYGRDFSYAIWADWGNRDYEDVMAAVDHLVGTGVVDAEHLGVGGWSYGGILTNYVITKTTRFKAAISGAGIANYLAGYGTDHYQHEYEAELGLPWRATDVWLKLSSPFLQIEKATTPTLFLCGEKDWNVPLINSEQMYQAMRRLGRETELVVYPGEDHSIDRPSFQKDRLDRYVAWYDKYLKPLTATTTTGAAPRSEAVSLLGRPLVPPPPSPEERQRLEDDLAKATAEFIKDPDDADRIIWLGRRLGYLNRYREAIDVYTRGIARHPANFRLYRHRGHRYITVRELDKAIADLSKAAELIRGVADEVEPDGIPNARNVPTSTSHFNIWYHLGLARYLQGDFEKALEAYGECMKFSTGSPDRLVATSDWMYMTLRRLGRAPEAARVLEPIRADLDVIEDGDYLERLLMYKGLKTPEALLVRSSADGGVSGPTLAYGVANWYLVNGQADRARDVLKQVVDGRQWAAFGYIAAEADLARMK
jgi:dipeptidyl aminopeptidase/acylaminoacyl peptidase